MQLTDIFTERILPLRDRLLRVAFGIVRQTEEAEDIVQDVLLKIWSKRSEWINLNNYEGYCITMAHNLSIDRIRRKAVPLQPLEYACEVSATEQNPYELAASKEAATQLRQAMQRLPEKQFLSIHLREVEGKSYSEIATMLDITMEQVKVNIHRARTALREQLIKKTNYGI